MKRAGVAGVPLALLLFCLLPSQAAGDLGYAKRQYVDQTLAGGEPFVLADNVHHTLIYTSHEGTTHLYRPGLVVPFDFASNYRNQVNLWRSDDNGKTWKSLNWLGTGFPTPPTENTGFSDPDLTQDTSGRVYDTGIDLANDALFSTKDGGKNWDKGTVQCHNGDRPWLAGGRRNEVFLASNTEDVGHAIFRSTDGGATCSSEGIPDQGEVSRGRSYVGNGKLLYDRRHDQLVEPIVFQNADGRLIGIGASTWQRGDNKFKPGHMIRTSLLSHWAAMAIDSGGTLYQTWDTDPRKDDEMGCGDTLTGNGASGSPLPNAVKLAYSRDYGRTWSKPRTVASPPDARVFWPWIAAGDAGKVAVTWYRSNRLADLDCENVFVKIDDAHLFHAASDDPAITHAVASRGWIHEHSTVCQGGTTCVATGQDRRLGDFFTNAIDPDGCELIASGDTTKPEPLTGQPRPIALPILIRQNSGPALVGDGSC